MVSLLIFIPLQAMAGEYDPAPAIDKSLDWMKSTSAYQQKMGAAALRANLHWLKTQGKSGPSDADFDRIQERAVSLKPGMDQSLLDSLYPTRLDLAFKLFNENRGLKRTDITYPLVHLALLKNALSKLKNADDFLIAVVAPIRKGDEKTNLSAREWIKSVLAERGQKALEVARCLLVNALALDFARAEEALKEDFHEVGRTLDACAQISGTASMDLFLRGLSVDNARKYSLYRWENLSIENLLKEAQTAQLTGNLDLKKVSYTPLDLFSPSRLLGKDRPPGPPTLEAKLGHLMHEISDGRRWIAVGGGIGGVPQCVYGCSSLDPIAVEPETGWAFFAVLDVKVPKVIIRHQGTEGKPELVKYFENEIRHVWKADDIPPSLVELSTRTPSKFPIIELLDFTETVKPIEYTIYQRPPAEKRTPEQEAKDRVSGIVVPLEERTPKKSEEKRHHGLFPFVKGMSAALETNGWFLNHPAETPVEEAAALSLARMGLMREFILANIKQKDTPDAPVSQRAHLLVHSAHVFAQALFNKFSGELGRQIQFIETVRVPVKDAQQKLSQALSDFATLSAEDGFELLGRASETLEIEKPDVVQSKDNLAIALTGAEFQLRELLANLESRKALACEMARRIEYSGAPLVPEMRLFQGARNVCGL